MNTTLTRLDLAGLKSIRNLNGFEFKRLNVLIGANGAGKSNLISFFKLLAWMTPNPGNLQTFIARTGGASSWLHDGPSKTLQIDATLTFEGESGQNQYGIKLFHASGDTLIFSEEKFRFAPHTLTEAANWTLLGAGHRESKLNEEAELGHATPKFIHSLLRRCVVYQFHNTTETARVRGKWNVVDGRHLKEDGANLAPFLYRLREQHPAHYHRIVETIRQISPFFADFELEPEAGKLLLQWRERGSDMHFGAHQASDGTLRLMALVALLMQPIDDLPAVIILDEPELGLHPFAISILAGILKSVSISRQVILATQSPTLIGYFEPEDIVVVERPERESQFLRLDSDRLSEWIENYSLAELWEKNVIGGRPS